LCIASLAPVAGCSYGDAPPAQPQQQPPPATTTTGEPLLTRRDAEPPRPGCPRGGTVISAGHDRNGDGVLSDDEIDVKKVAALEGARVITGSLEIASDTGVRLPRLAEIAGDLTVSGKLTVLALPALQYVGGNADVAAPAVGALAFPALERDGVRHRSDRARARRAPRAARGLQRQRERGAAGGAAAGVLADLAGLEHLTSIGRALRLRDNPLLSSLAGLDGLASVLGDVVIEYDDALPPEQIDAFRKRLGR
jgi:hypothetical protein